MEFENYQQRAFDFSLNTKFKDIPGTEFIYPALGLAEEAGEVAGKISKALRDNNGDMQSETFKEAIKKELGDVLWFVSELCTVFNLDLEDVARSNINKLASRKNRNKIQGNGDDR
jgi:NTP pyrophosphatase (non-canonical NTP hydrolase)